MSAPSLYPEELLTSLESMDFFLAKPLLFELREPLLEDMGEEPRVERSPDRLFICSALPSRNVLNSFGASSGCNLAGTQNNLAESSSEAVGDGALGIAAGFRVGKSGSPAACTSIDILRRACRLLNS